MDINLLKLLRDARDVLLFRFYPIDHYRYGLPVMLMLMVAVGVVNALMLKPMLGNGQSVMMLGFVFALLKWLLLTRATTSILQYFGSPRIPFLGYALLTESLVLPLLLLPYFPEMAMIFQLWNLWIFWAQLIGFARISQQPISKVLIAYVVYFILVMAFGLIMLGLFNLGGWLDMTELQKNIEKLMKQ